MSKPRNYDSPFGREGNENEDELYVTSEQIENTDFIDYDDNYPPKGSLLNIRADVFYPTDVDTNTKKEESDAFIKYKEMDEYQ